MKRDEISINRQGDIIVTNLPEVNERSHMVLLNYKIGDTAEPLKKRDDEVVTLIGGVEMSGCLFSWY